MAAGIFPLNESKHLRLGEGKRLGHRGEAVFESGVSGPPGALCPLCFLSPTRPCGPARTLLLLLRNVCQLAPHAQGAIGLGGGWPGSPRADPTPSAVSIHRAQPPPRPGSHLPLGHDIGVREEGHGLRRTRCHLEPFPPWGGPSWQPPCGWCLGCGLAGSWAGSQL